MSSRRGVTLIKDFEPIDPTPLTQLGEMAAAGLAACERVKVKPGAELTTAENYAVMALVCTIAFWSEEELVKELADPTIRDLVARGVLTIEDAPPHNQQNEET